jgi:hypothetical protein
MKVWPLLAVALALSPVPSAAPAEVIKRDLTDNEKLDYSVAESQAILRGKLLEVVDAQVPQAGSSKLATYRYVLVQPKKWLKGTGATKPIAIGFADGGEDLFRTIRAWAGTETDEVMFFLHKLGKGETFPAPSALSRLATVDYVLEAGPYQYERGAMKVGPGDDIRIDERLEGAAKSRSLDSLVVRSNLTLLGTAVSEGDCRIAGRGDRCTRVRIDRLLAGSSVDSEIPVYGVFEGPIPGGQNLFFLKLTPDESYEILSFRAGVMSVENGKVGSLGKSLNDVIGRIKIVARATRGPGD